MVKAVLDVGSNSVLTLVAERTGTEWVVLRETSAVTGLGRGTKTTGLLEPDAIEETLRAVRTGFDLAKELGATEVVAGGTMALRIARNAEDFVVAADAQGTPVQVISGDQEAQLGFEAVANDPEFREHARISIVDPGGHSTEMVTADRVQHQPAGAPYALSSWDVRYRQSFAVGALGLREGVLSAESPDFSARLRAVQQIDDLIGLSYRPNEGGHVVVLGATGTNLVSIREQLLTWQPDRVHGQWLDYEEISRSVGWMFELSDAERRAIPGMEAGRERTLHIGALTLERFLFALKVLGCSVSVRGWRHALLDHAI